MENDTPTITPKELISAKEKGARILDLREIQERELAHIPDSFHIPLAKIPAKAKEILPDPDSTIICYCTKGLRSQKAAQILSQLGYKNVLSLAGGLEAWPEKIYPLQKSKIFSEAEIRRYEKHLKLAEIGPQGQERLKKAHVLIVGAGGLGSPLAYYLAAAGVGTLGIADHDHVSESNLQRQILYSSSHVGLSKADTAQGVLSRFNPLIKVIAHPEKITAENVSQLIQDYDIVADASDNFATRYLLNDASLELGKALMHGSIYAFEGMVTVFKPGGPCYRCLYPEAPPAELSPNCALTGVLGALPGIIGTLQAVEVIKLILKRGQGLAGRLLCYDALAASFHEIAIAKNPDCLCRKF